MDATDLTKVPKEIVEVFERAQKAAWDVQWTPRTDSDEPPLLIMWIPNGRDKRRQPVGLARAKRLLKFPFEQYRLLGGYSAINNSSEGYIEVSLRSPIRSLSRYSSNSIFDIPGIEILEDTTDSVTDEAGEAVDETAESSTEKEAIQAGAHWRLSVEDDHHPWSIEFSEVSEECLALTSDSRVMRNLRPPTLKIRGINAPRYEDALRQLEDISGAVFFDLEICYGTQLELSRQLVRPNVRPYRPEPLTRAPSFPRLRYPPEALSLYWYGRSAFGMPLLQFLAYYQVLEFFFPMYFRQHLLRRLRQELTNPRFDITDDAHLARLLATMTSSGRSGYGSERDQLNATINGCVDEPALRAFLLEDPERLRMLGDKKIIKFVPLVIDDGHHGSLIDQVTERIYSIRCRVVHSKGDGGEMAVDLLLPGSPEADSLVIDVSVLQFLAQKAIVAGGTAFY